MVIDYRNYQHVGWWWTNVHFLFSSANSFDWAETKKQTNYISFCFIYWVKFDCPPRGWRRLRFSLPSVCVFVSVLVDELMESSVVMRKRAKCKPVVESLDDDAQTTGDRTSQHQHQQTRRRRRQRPPEVLFLLVTCCLLALCFLVSTASALPPVIRIGKHHHHHSLIL
jgi:hypothetical protein